MFDTIHCLLLFSVTLNILRSQILVFLEDRVWYISLSCGKRAGSVDGEKKRTFFSASDKFFHSFPISLALSGQGIFLKSSLVMRSLVKIM